MSRIITLYNNKKIIATDLSTPSRIVTNINSIEELVELYYELNPDNIKSVTVTNMDGTVYGHFENREFGGISIYHDKIENSLKCVISLNPPSSPNISEELEILKNKVTTLELEKENLLIKLSKNFEMQNY